METYTAGEHSRKASLWVLIIVALLIGGFLGYYLGAKGVGTGLIEDEDDVGSATTSDTSLETENETEVEAPANPFEEEGYTNPFE